MENDNKTQRFNGELIVEIEKIETLNSTDGQEAIIHIRPVRFEAFQASPANLNANTPLDQISPVAFTLPVDIKRFTQNDVLREREAKKKTEKLAREEEIKRRQEENQAREAKRIAEREKKDAEYELKEKLRLEQQEKEQVAEKERREKLQEERRKKDLEKVAKYEAAKRKSNELLDQGYLYEDIDWSIGEPLPGKKPQPLPTTRSGSLLGKFLTLMFLGSIGLMGFVFYRFRTEKLGDDLEKLSEFLLKIKTRIESKE